MLYLQDKLSAEMKHEVEKKLLESEFTDDAVEGLKEIKDKKKGLFWKSRLLTFFAISIIFSALAFPFTRRSIKK